MLAFFIDFYYPKDIIRKIGNLTHVNLIGPFILALQIFYCLDNFVIRAYNFVNIKEQHGTSRRNGSVQGP
jgi:hypothetical protein